MVGTSCFQQFVCPVLALTRDVLAFQIVHCFMLQQWGGGSSIHTDCWILWYSPLGLHAAQGLDGLYCTCGELFVLVAAGRPRDRVLTQTS